MTHLQGTRGLLLEGEEVVRCLWGRAEGMEMGRE